MSHKYHGAPHRLRLRALAASALVFAAIACNPDESTAPVTDPESAPAATPAVAEETPTVEFASASASAAGVPFGDFHVPSNMYNAPYTGALHALWPSSATSSINSAKNAGMRLVVSMGGARRYYTNSNGTFNMSKWKKQIDQYRKVNFASFVSAGTVIGHYLVDEPACSVCWGGTKISYSQIEEMARYSKSIWPSMPTGVRSSPSQLGGARFKSLDFAWAQWGGPLHTPAFKMSPEQFRDTQISAAKKLGLGLVFGLNYLDGGDGTSRINGTYAKDPNLKDNKYCKSAGMLPLRDERGGGEEGRNGLRQGVYACAVISWKYDATFRNRSGMKDALAAVASAAKGRSRTSCKV